MAQSYGKQKVHVDDEDKLGSQIATSGQNRKMTVNNKSLSSLGQRSINAHVDDEDKLTRQFTDSGQNRTMTVIN